MPDSMAMPGMAHDSAAHHPMAGAADSAGVHGGHAAKPAAKRGAKPAATPAPRKPAPKKPAPAKKGKPAEPPMPGMHMPGMKMTGDSAHHP